MKGIVPLWDEGGGLSYNKPQQLFINKHRKHDQGSGKDYGIPPLRPEAVSQLLFDEIRGIFPRGFTPKIIR
jgi:hypothetical protein